MPEIPSTTTSSPQLNHMFSVSRVTSNGNGGIISSVIWLVVSAGLCLPWLVDKPSSGKVNSGEARSVAWIVVLAVDLIIGTMSVFSLWFRRSTLSIILLLWGVGAIVATYLMGSFAMLPAVATMCCCAPDVCILGAANISALDEDFCRINPNLCMETRWSLWCYYGGILLAMVSIVLLVNGVALHHKTVVACEFQRTQALKAALEARREQRRREELWEQDVYGRGNHASNAVEIGTNPKQPADDENTTPPREGRSLVTPTFQSPASNTCKENKPSAASGKGRAMPPSIPSAPRASTEREDGEVQESRLTNSMPRARGGRGAFGRGALSIGPYTGLRNDRGKNAIEEGRTRPGSWGARTPTNGDVVMSWVADEEQGGGPITPKTALRFKTSAIARAMHN